MLSFRNSPPERAGQITPTNHWVALFALALTVCANACFAQAPVANADSWAGRWIGEIPRGGSTDYLMLRLLPGHNPPLGWYRRPAIEGFATPDLTPQISGDNFVVELAPTGIRLELLRDGDVLRGVSIDSAGRHPLTLTKIPAVTDETWTRVVGTYRAPDGSVVSIERESFAAIMLDRRTQHTARLLPQGGNEFVGGPTLELGRPVRIRASFAGDGSSVTLTPSAGSPVTLTKLDLYVRRDVRIQSTDVALAGTLRVPPGPARRPAVLIIQGSNQQVRGGQWGFNAFVADAFARAGFVVLNYDKRGVGDSTGTWDDHYDHLSDDAAAAVRLLRAHPEVDPDRVGAWGISQGGQLLPIVDRKVGGLAFLINQSGSVVNNSQQEIERVELQLRADGFSAADVRAAVAFQQRKFDYACTRKDWEGYIAQYDLNKDKPWMPDPYIGPPSTREDSAWEFWKCGEDPWKFWETVTAPVLTVFGQHETYFDAAVNEAALRKALRVAKNGKLEVRILPGANHNMLVAKTGGEREMSSLDRYVPGHFDLVTRWARKIVAGR